MSTPRMTPRSKSERLFSTRSSNLFHREVHRETRSTCRRWGRLATQRSLCRDACPAGKAVWGCGALANENDAATPFERVFSLDVAAEYERGIVEGCAIALVAAAPLQDRDSPHGDQGQKQLEDGRGGAYRAHRAAREMLP